MVLRTICILLAFCLLSAGPADCADSKTPKRIVSLGPTFTEEIYLLEAEDMLVGVTTFCQKPERAKEKERIGEVTNVNFEKIVALEPDIIIATPMTNKTSVERMKELKLNVVYFDYAKDFSDVCGQFLRLAALVEKEVRAEEILSGIKKKVDAIKKRNERAVKTRVFVQIGADPLFAAKKDTYINSIIEFAGGENIVSGTEEGMYSREKVLASDPEVIIVATMGIVGESELKEWRRYRSLSAAKNGRIYIVDPYEFCSATPMSFIEALEETDKILNEPSYNTNWRGKKKK